MDLFHVEAGSKPALSGDGLIDSFEVSSSYEKRGRFGLTRNITMDSCVKSLSMKFVVWAHELFHPQVALSSLAIGASVPLADYGCAFPLGFVLRRARLPAIYADCIGKMSVSGLISKRYGRTVSYNSDSEKLMMCLATKRPNPVLFD